VSKLQGKVVAITGGSSGIGLATAEGAFITRIDLPVAGGVTAV
jgi:NAD(P)-dependent dehydrogenase (short-subunit alcohol dehydrogenase family)